MFCSIAASEDYVAASFSVTFVPDFSDSRILCGNISITFDEIVEDMEEFRVYINSVSSRLEFKQGGRL